MRAGVSITTLRRLARVEQRRSATRPTAAWPPMLTPDAWEEIAVPQQAQLIADVREETLGPGYRDGPVGVPDPANVSHKYKPGMHLGGIVVRS